MARAISLAYTYFLVVVAGTSDVWMLNISGVLRKTILHAIECFFLPFNINGKVLSFSISIISWKKRIVEAVLLHGCEMWKVTMQVIEKQHCACGTA